LYEGAQGVGEGGGLRPFTGAKSPGERRRTNVLPPGGRGSLKGKGEGEDERRNGHREG